jgi:ribosomal protein S18 acetylase RimI-like enzyme
MPSWSIFPDVVGLVQNRYRQRTREVLNFSGLTCLYVDPLEWRKGWGTHLVNFAKQVSPRGLELDTHQENFVARALYERHGFRAVKFGLSPPPESAPDVEYHCRPE